MKITNFVYVFCVAFMALSCSEGVLEEDILTPEDGTGNTEDPSGGPDDPGEKTEMDFVTDFPDNFGTKTSIDGDRMVLWSEGDKLSIFDGTDNNEFSLTSGAGENIGNFRGKAFEAETYHALYPYSADASYSDGTVSSALPSVQTAVSGTFATMLNPALGSSTGTGLRMKNIAGLIQFTVSEIPSGKTVTGVTFSAEKSLAGPFTANISSAVASATGNENVSVTVQAAEGEALETGKIYYAVVLPGTYSTLSFTASLNDGSTYSRTAETSVTVNVGGGISIEVPASGPVEDLYALYEAGEEISIAGKSYSKSEWGEASFISSDTELTEFGSQIYFVSPDATLTYNAAGSFEDLVIIGNSMTRKSKVELKHRIQHRSSVDNEGTLLMYNVELTMNGYQLTHYSDTRYGYIGFVDCDIETSCEASGAYPIFISKSSVARNYNELVMEDCDIHIQEGSAQRFLLSHSTGINEGTETDYTRIVLRNNIFWSGAEACTKFKFFNQFAGIGELVLEKNTIVNLMSDGLNGLFSYRSIGSLTIQDNIYYNPEHVTQYLGFFYQKNYNTVSGVNPDNPTAGTCSHNILYQGACDKNYATFVNGWSTVDTSGWTAHEDFTEITSSPFATADYSTGTFTQTSEYADFGAVR